MLDIEKLHADQKRFDRCVEYISLTEANVLRWGSAHRAAPTEICFPQIRDR